MATIRKRGAYQWEAQIRKRGYPLQSKTFNTKPEAEAWARQIENEIDRGAWISRSEAETTTLAEALERYRNEISSEKATHKRECYLIDAWLARPISRRFLATLRGADFAKHRDQRRAEGRAENTVRIELALIAHLFEIARKEWGMEGLLNPLKNIRKPSGSAERDRRLRPGEYERITADLYACENTWVGPAFDLAIETSLRQGMLFKLRWEWVDLGRQVITVPRAFRGIENKGVPAELPLSSKAVAVLRALPRSIDGKVLGCSQNAVVCSWKRALARLGIDDLHWHDLRHEAASRFFEKGLHPMQVASIPERRGATEIVLSGTQKHQPEMDHADPGLESRTESLYHRVRRPHRPALT